MTQPWRSKFQPVSSTLVDILTLSRGLQLGSTWRRTSLRSDLPDVETVEGTSEYERARKKVERNVILQAGYGSVQMWSAAMEALMVSRRMSLLMPRTANGSRSASTQSAHTDRRSSSRSLASDMDHITVSDDHSRQSSPSPKPSYAATLAVPSPRRSVDSALGLTDITNKSAAPRVIRVMPPDKSRPQAEPRDFGVRTRSPTAIESADESKDNVNRFTRWQQQLLVRRQVDHGGASDGYRDKSLVCTLPLPVCQRILQHVMIAEELTLLSERQQMKALEWGQLKDTLMTEYGWGNKDRSSQIWMLLEAVEGLVYE